MTDLYLIAHKVRGEPAFDIASRMECPECNGTTIAQPEINGVDVEGCAECDELGYWWIIPTSGHRAYPYHTALISEDSMMILDEIPIDLHDHYPARTEPNAPNLLDRLNLRPTLPPIVRRI